MKHTKLVWDGKKLEVPEDMGCPKENQLKGSDLDNLSELAGRNCYDSLGSGRDSVEYHKHIIEVGHGSVTEHANLTFATPVDIPTYLACAESLVNRPGIWMTKEIPTILVPGMPKNGFIMRITANIRAIREWHEFPPANQIAILLGNQIQYLAKEKAPLLMQGMEPKNVGIPLQIVEPKYEDEIWITMFFTNVSRGFSHELVRHKYRTAVSQRSTRYVDEGDSDWCWHPLILKNIDVNQPVFMDDGKTKNFCNYSLSELKRLCQDGYKALVDKLQSQLITEGTDKFTARKQARGAARGLLGNALNTELIFSASLSQWKWMLQLRAAAAADAEIRVVFNEVYEILSERFPDHFQGYEKVECPDKIGYGLKEPEPTLQGDQ
jgi:thymidylate synthase ThyX